MKIAIRLNAGNDVNGNPRRVFVVLDPMVGVIDAIDEGYEGEAELRKRYRISSTADLDTTPRQYRELVKRARDWESMMRGKKRSR